MLPFRKNWVRFYLLSLNQGSSFSICTAGTPHALQTNGWKKSPPLHQRGCSTQKHKTHSNRHKLFNMHGNALAICFIHVLTSAKSKRKQTMLNSSRSQPFVNYNSHLSALSFLIIFFWLPVSIRYSSEMHTNVFSSVRNKQSKQNSFCTLNECSNRPDRVNLLHPNYIISQIEINLRAHTKRSNAKQDKLHLQYRSRMGYNKVTSNLRTVSRRNFEVKCCTTTTH